MEKVEECFGFDVYQLFVSCSAAFAALDDFLCSQTSGCTYFLFLMLYSSRPVSCSESVRSGAARTPPWQMIWPEALLHQPQLTISIPKSNEYADYNVLC